MSTVPHALTPEAVLAITANNYISLSCAVLILFDHAVTFDQELSLVWKPRLTVSSILFIINRYILLFGATVFILRSAPWTLYSVSPPVLALPAFTQPVLQSCLAFTRIENALSIVAFINIALFSGLRAYAVGGKQWKVASLVLILGLVPAATNIYYFIHTTVLVVPPPILGCAEISNMDNSVEMKYVRFSSFYTAEMSTHRFPRRFVIGTRVCMVAADALVLLMTWFSTRDIRKAAARAHYRAGLSMLLLRDGTLYFATLLIFNALHIILSITISFQELAEFVDVLGAILISRFLLNLRQVCVLNSHPVSRHGLNSALTSSRFSNIRFAASMSLGNIGEQLDVGDDAQNPAGLEVVDPRSEIPIESHELTRRPSHATAPDKGKKRVPVECPLTLK
ncbi:hypothetical protein BXZ70DRAFT_1004834 [Cristinia sonorae]|uniref:DUF6533 domain-containing protein n=1 Tax=Cristinia sonorae TaxID=1940300 RepID=A0A8K0UW74_9AGAR|nr:hypothetical protein BXZ70DRAFT_1004834 [Cristinia sonorae]